MTTTPDTTDGLDTLAAEVAAERHEPADDRLVVPLVTSEGTADIKVPPRLRWRSTARHALFVLDDDLTWARRTLDRDNLQLWLALDPTEAEVKEFFDEFGRRQGISLGEATAS